MACIFCGSTGPMTKEHIFPAWLAALFPDVPEADHIRHFEELDGSRKETNRWSAGTFTRTVRDVCATCNSGWMARLEAEAQPILTPLILDDARVLDLTEMQLAATWATKTALVAGRGVPGERDTASAESYLWFGEHRCPLPGGIVWLGRYEGDGQWPVSLHQHGATYSKLGESLAPTGLHYRGFHTVFAIGHLVLAVFGHEIPGDPMLRGGSSARRALIWPTTTSVRWPPGSSMTEALLTEESAELPEPPT